MLAIRAETPSDTVAVRAVHLLAFKTPAEADLVDALRARGAGILSLVADLDGKVIGHIFFSLVTISGPHGFFEAAGLAPVAVHPNHQSCGVGSALILRSLEELRSMGHKAVILLGHADYYPRFGFQPASLWGIYYTVEVPDPAFMALELIPGSLDGISGVAHFQPEFDVV